MFSRIIILGLLFLTTLLAQDKGLNHYQNKEFEAARQYYESVLRQKGNQPQAQFGRGSSAFQQGDLETAKQAFEQSLKSNDEKLKSKAMYNLGNTFYQNQKTDEALAFYRKALELDPSDKEAKFNYEFLKYQQQPPEDQQQQEQDQSQDNQEQQQEQEKKDKEKKEQEQQDNQEKQQEEEQENQEQQQEQENQEQQQQPQQQEEANEEKSQDLKQAESILDALKQDEKIMQKRQIAKAKSRKLAKDW